MIIINGVLFSNKFQDFKTFNKLVFGLNANFGGISITN